MALERILDLFLRFTTRERKCKFVKRCPLYLRDNNTCNKTGGVYYGVTFNPRPAGCYRKVESGEIRLRNSVRDQDICPTPDFTKNYTTLALIN